MKEPLQYALLGALGLAVVAAAGCSTATTVTAPCCYDGPVLSTRLASLTVQLEDGRRLPFENVYQGFRPRDALITRTLPLTRLTSADLVYSSLVPLLALYDANGDGRLEEPELLVLYAREAALAVGIRLAHLGEPPGVWALSTANADVAGLVAWVEERLAMMSPGSRQVFADLQRVGLEQRSSAGDMGGKGGEKFVAP